VGYGDYLMLSGAVRELKRRFPGVAITALGAENAPMFRQVFAGNPYITYASQLRPEQRHFDLPLLRLDKPDEAAGRNIWMPGFTPIPGNLYLRPDELQWALRATTDIRQRSGCAALVYLNPYAKPSHTMPSGEHRVYPYHVNKEWGIERYAAVIRAAGARIAFLQPNAFDDPRPFAEGAHSVANCPSFRHAAALLSHCDAYLGCEGGMHHAAAALGIRGVVIYGGWISPGLSGYACHDNVYRGRFRDACGLRSECAHCREAMAAIPPAELVQRLKLAIDLRE
jgi:ADP-heptose:LPS heptosyltransferase